MKELAKMRANVYSNTSLGPGDTSTNLDDELELLEQTITVRVSTKDGVHKWELKKVQYFMNH